MSKYPVHSDFKPLQKKKPLFLPMLFSLSNKRSKKYISKMDLPDNVNITPVNVPGFNGQSTPVKIYSPKHSNPDTALIYFHGGSFAYKEAPYQINLYIDYAVKTPCKVITVDYSLIPDHPYPAALFDCYEAVKWTVQHAGTLGIDSEKIAVGGDDSGAALAAGVTLLARDREEFKIGFQMLIHPVTSMKMTTPSMKTYRDTPMWHSGLNQKMWQLYLKNTDDTAYASPLDVTRHDYLPDAYIETAEFDCLRDEGIAYASVLERTGIKVELNETKGTVHNFDVIEDSEITIEHKNRRIKALQQYFNHR